MDLVLVSITAISLVLAIVMSLIVFRLVREERLRSEARVSLLKEAVGEGPSLDLFQSEAAAQVPFPGEATGQIAGLFSLHQPESLWLQRAAVAVAVALTVAAAGYVATRQDEGPRQAAGVSSAPLELIALQHSAETDSLTISGTLVNPSGGATVTDIEVTAFALGSNGSVLASGRAPLEYRTLAPGEESNFLVKIPVQGMVTRYRVGFRRPDGSVITHVDRRIDASSVRYGGSTESASWVR